MLESHKNQTDYQGKTGLDETIGNQQEMLSQAEIGWLAGIVEGEGSITMNARTKKWKGWKGFGVDMQIYAVNTDAGIIEKCVNILKKLGINPYIYERTTAPIPRKRNDGTYGGEKTIISVNVNRMGEILTVLKCILPHIAGEKKSRAKLIIEFIERRMTRKGEHTNDGAAWMDKDDWQIVKDFYVLKGCDLKPELKQFLNEHTSSETLSVN